MTKRSHLYEVVICNSIVWMKIQASFQSPDQLVEFFQRRLTRQVGMRVDYYNLDAPFKASILIDNLANWASVVDQLPAGWDRDEYRFDGEPYPWCETLSDGCDCHASRGRLDLMYCADFGLHKESDRRARKSKNAHYRYDVEWLETAIVNADKHHKNRATSPPPPPQGTVLISPNPGLDLTHVPAGLFRIARSAVDPLANLGMYCSIHKRRHAYSNSVIQMTLSSVVSALGVVPNLVEIAMKKAPRYIGYVHHGNNACTLFPKEPYDEESILPAWYRQEDICAVIESRGGRGMLR